MSHTISPAIELTVLMPCLDEAETVATCIRKARRFLDDHGVTGEVLVVDNGSEDGSPGIALAEGARVIHVAQRGYGAALIAGIASAEGHFVVMGDADDSYDFTRLMPFLELLRSEAERIWSSATGSRAASRRGQCRYPIDISAITC